MKFDVILLQGANKKAALRNYTITRLKSKPKALTKSHSSRSNPYILGESSKSLHSKGIFSNDKKTTYTQMKSIRWSLIAGRLPGKSETDVRIYWNTDLRNNVQSEPEPQAMTKANIIKPQKLKSLCWLGGKGIPFFNVVSQYGFDLCKPYWSTTPLSPSEFNELESMWWERSLQAMFDNNTVINLPILMKLKAC
ncbi:hypothetical protein SADUNF_Sadunf17G0115900 [Salix dunnii]|uniref:Uncharacterized protein n=1 Tax=Salix dunnii TaxID=1413687 RepID=A0A835J6S2_9ROSI|nr:hypothetical protein SADUNF_Sadunf17G0115900 [Salix dunnii]